MGDGKAGRLAGRPAAGRRVGVSRGRMARVVVQLVACVALAASTVSVTVHWQTTMAQPQTAGVAADIKVKLPEYGRQVDTVGNTPVALALAGAASSTTPPLRALRGPPQVERTSKARARLPGRLLAGSASGSDQQGYNGIVPLQCVSLDAEKLHHLHRCKGSVTQPTSIALPSLVKHRKHPLFPIPKFVQTIPVWSFAFETTAGANRFHALMVTNETRQALSEAWGGGAPIEDPALPTVDFLPGRSCVNATSCCQGLTTVGELGTAASPAGLPYEMVLLPAAPGQKMAVQYSFIATPSADNPGKKKFLDRKPYTDADSVFMGEWTFLGHLGTHGRYLQTAFFAVVCYALCVLAGCGVSCASMPSCFAAALCRNSATDRAPVEHSDDDDDPVHIPKDSSVASLSLLSYEEDEMEGSPRARRLARPKARFNSTEFLCLCVTLASMAAGVMTTVALCRGVHKWYTEPYVRVFSRPCGMQQNPTCNCAVARSTKMSPWLAIKDVWHRSSPFGSTVLFGNYSCATASYSVFLRAATVQEHFNRSLVDLAMAPETCESVNGTVGGAPLTSDEAQRLATYWPQPIGVLELALAHAEVVSHGPAQHNASSVEDAPQLFWNLQALSMKEIVAQDSNAFTGSASFIMICGLVIMVILEIYSLTVGTASVKRRLTNLWKPEESRVGSSKRNISCVALLRAKARSLARSATQATWSAFVRSVTNSGMPYNWARLLKFVAKGLLVLVVLPDYRSDWLYVDSPATLNGAAAMVLVLATALPGIVFSFVTGLVTGCVGVFMLMAYVPTFLLYAVSLAMLAKVGHIATLIAIHHVGFMVSVHPDEQFSGDH